MQSENTHRRKRCVGGRHGVSGREKKCVSIRVLEQMVIVEAAYLLIILMRGSQGRKGVVVLTRRNLSLEVQFIMKAPDIRETRASGVTGNRIEGIIGTRGGCCVQDYHVNGMDTRQ